MEDILASIRRILNEDDPNQAAAREAAQERAESSDVFALDASMMIDDPAAAHHPELPVAEAPLVEAPVVETPAVQSRVVQSPAVEPHPIPPAGRDLVETPRREMAVPAAPEPAPPPPPPPAPEVVPPSWPAGLVAPEAAAAAATSVGSLRRALEAGRAPLAVRNGGPTLDEMVREELRPVLKGWLDANLPPMVERLVRAEIERLVGRSDL